MEWLREHGSKLLAFLLTLLAGGNGLDPTLITSMLGETGKRWAAFLLGAATLAHSTLVAPQAAARAVARSLRPGDPPVTRP